MSVPLRQPHASSRPGRGPVLPGLVVVVLVMLASWLVARAGGDGSLVDGGGASASGAGYVFLQISPGTGGPVTFDPCQPVSYVVNPAGGPSDWEEIVTTAAARVSAASGFDLSYGGPTSDATGSRTSIPAPILVTFADASTYPPLTGASGVAHQELGYATAGHVVATGGEIVLDAEWYDDRGLLGLVGGADEDRLIAVVMHEFAHTLGLGHVDDPAQLMHGGGSIVDDFGDGDRAGLAALRAAPCSS